MMNLMRLLEKLSDDNARDPGEGYRETGIHYTSEKRDSETILTHQEEASLTAKNVVRSLVDKIPEDVLEQTRVRKKESDVQGRY